MIPISRHHLQISKKSLLAQVPTILQEHINANRELRGSIVYPLLVVFPDKPSLLPTALQSAQHHTMLAQSAKIRVLYQASSPHRVGLQL